MTLTCRVQHWPLLYLTDGGLRLNRQKKKRQWNVEQAGTSQGQVSEECKKGQYYIACVGIRLRLSFPEQAVAQLAAMLVMGCGFQPQSQAPANYVQGHRQPVYGLNFSSFLCALLSVMILHVKNLGDLSNTVCTVGSKKAYMRYLRQS